MKTKRPLPKEFDSSKFQDELEKLNKNMKGLEIEHRTEFLVPHILKKYEGFEKIEKGPFKGAPFDFLGFKNNIPYIIEYKGSLNNFSNTPGEKQKIRLQEVLKQFDELEIVLLQINIKKSQYRIFYTEQVKEFFFKGTEIPLEPVISWLRDRV